MLVPLKLDAVIFPEAVIWFVTVKSPVRVSVVFSKNELVAEFCTYEAVADVGANELVCEFNVNELVVEFCTYEAVADVGANELVCEFRVYELVTLVKRFKINISAVFTAMLADKEELKNVNAPEMSVAICAEEEIKPDKKLEEAAYVNSPPTVL